MPSFPPTQSTQSYDGTLHLLNSSLTLVSISEDCEYNPTIVRQNGNLRRGSFGNKSCKTGLDEIANSYSKICNGLASPRSTRFGSAVADRRCEHDSSNHNFTGWGFFIDD